MACSLQARRWRRTSSLACRCGCGSRFSWTCSGSLCRDDPEPGADRTPSARDGRDGLRAGWEARGSLSMTQAQPRESLAWAGFAPPARRWGPQSLDRAIAGDGCWRVTRATSTVTLMTRGRLYGGNTLLERLPQDLEDIAAELGQFIQEAHPVVGPRHLARPWHVAAAGQPRVRNGMLGGAELAGRDQRRTCAGEPGDAVEARDLQGLGRGHRGQDGGQPPRQPRLPRPRGAEQEEDVLVRQPVLLFTSSLHSR
jgi:hypothetical protein